MRVYYDNEVDAVYIKLGNQKPEGVVEISEGKREVNDFNNVPPDLSSGNLLVKP